MNTRPEALRLADALDAQVEVGGGDLGELEDASAELRRLHEVNQNLLKALNEFVAAADGVNAEPVAEIQTEDMGKPFNAIRVTAHFYAEVPAVGTKLYKAPPKREWVGLTDEEKIELWNKHENHWRFEDNLMAFTRAIEAKLKEKNT